MYFGAANGLNSEPNLLDGMYIHSIMNGLWFQFTINTLYIEIYELFIY